MNRSHRLCIHSAGLRLVLLALGLTLGLCLLPAPVHAAGPAWMQKVVSNDIVYFAFASPARIERYDMAADRWLPSIALTNAPTAFAVDARGMAIAYNRQVVTRALDGTNESNLLTLAQNATGILLSDTFLFIICPATSAITSVRRSDRQTVATWTGSHAFGGGFAIAPIGRRLYGIDTTRSNNWERDLFLSELSYNADGTFSSGTALTRTAYYKANDSYLRLFVSPDERTLTAANSDIFDRETMAYRLTLAGGFDDLAYYGNDVPVFLRGNKLDAYSTAFLPAGTCQLSSPAQALAIRAGQAFAFSADTTSPSGVAVAQVALSNFSTAQPGAAINPEAIYFLPDDVIPAGDDTYFFYSKSYQAVFRWSAKTRRYIATYRLSGSASAVTYSPALNRLYAAYGDGRVAQIKLDTGSSVEEFFANLPSEARGLQAAGSFIFCADATGAGDTHYVFGSDGAIKSSRGPSHSSLQYLWSPVRQRMYSLNNANSPNGILYEPINGTGQLGASQAPYYAGNYGYVYVNPLRLSTDESRVLLASGMEVSAIDLLRTGTLPNAITDAAAQASRWVTIRGVGFDTQLQTWTQNLVPDRAMTISQLFPVRVLNLSDGRLLVLNTTKNPVGWSYDNYGAWIPGRLIMSVVDLSAAGTIETAPNFLTNPTDTTAYRNRPVSLTFTAQGTDLTYQWLKDGQPVAGATSATLILATAQFSDAGSYSVIISNSFGSVTSSSAVLGVLETPPEPFITSQPRSTTAWTEASASFSVTATGINLTYQWRKHGSPIAGATSSTLLIPHVVPAVDYAGYDVVIANSLGSVTSETVTLSTPPIPTIDRQPVAFTCGVGENAIFSVTATSSGLSYEWYKDGLALGGNMTDTLTINSVKSSDFGVYYVVVINKAGSVQSASVALSFAAPSLVRQPLAAASFPGGSATFSVTAASSSLSYQWYKGGVPVAGAASASLTINPVTESDYGSYYVAVTNPVGSVQSAIVSLAPPARIVNLSVRTDLSAGQVLILGFVTNAGNKDVLVRAAGPYLTSLNLGLLGLSDPRMYVYNGQTVLLQNDDWDPSLAAVFSRLGASPFSSGSKDSAALLSFNGTGNRTVQTSGPGTGTVLVETYDASPSLTTRLINVSARNHVGTGNAVLIAGFVLTGDAPAKVLIRGLGPDLLKFGVPDPLADPVLTIFHGNEVIASNDNWDTSLAPTFSLVGAGALTPGSTDAAILVTLSPGVYSAILSGKDNGTGEGLVEIFEVP